VFLLQVWKLPVAERSLDAVVVGLNVQVPLTVGAEPDESVPSLAVSVLFELVQVWVAAQRAFALEVPPVTAR
jgi:hypothetical protein